MADNDEALQSRIATLAAESGGSVSFRAIKSSDLASALGEKLGTSRNAVYEFTVEEADGSTFQCVGYSLILNGPIRPATRAEALGRALASTDGRLFKANPFLLVFDYVGNRLLVVSAAKLFGAFAKKVEAEPIVPSNSSSFSLSPNFENATINMYATVTEPDLWATSTAGDDLTLNDLKSHLIQIRDETKVATPEIPAIVAALKARIEADEAKERAKLAQTKASLAPVSVLPLSIDPTAKTEGEIKVSPRTWRMILRAIKSSQAVILVGPPGTGKTALLRKAMAAFAQPGSGINLPMWATPDESWTARDLVGGDSIMEGEIVFRPGWVLRAIEQDRWLVLDEANRADMDRIFGGLLTWLSGGSVSLGKSSTSNDAKTIELGWKSGPSRKEDIEAASEGAVGSVRYLAGENWRLLGTYNALDAQRVFRFGAALGRRFVRVPIPAVDPEMFAEILSERAPSLSPTVRDAVLSLYTAHFESENTRLGPALFLAVCNYLQVAAAERAVGDQSLLTEIQGAALEDATEDLAEAYVVNIGTWIANLEPQDLEQLRQRVVASGALGDEDWSWLVKMSLSLA